MKNNATANALLANDAPIQAVAQRATHLARSFGLTRSDLEQELFLHCFQQMERYDPSRASLTTFLTRIATNRVLSLVEQASAAKRGGQSQTISLDELPER